MELDEFRAVSRRAGSTSNDAALAPAHAGLGHARRADGPAVEGEAAHLRRRLDALGLARAGRRPRRLHAAAGLPRRGAHLARPRRARHLLDDRGAGAHDDRLRRAASWRPRWCRGCCGATRRGARGSPSRAPAATSPRSPAGPSRTDDGWRVTGQKVWTSLAQYAQRCVLLTRTGTPESAHRGHHRAVRRHGHPRDHRPPDRDDARRARVLARSSSTTSRVPFDRTLGDEGQGWAVAMDLLPYERSTALWHRAAFLHRRLQQLLDAAPAGALDPARVGEVTQILYAFRARSRATQHRLHAGEQLGRGDLHRQGAAGDRRAGGVRPRRRRPRRRRDDRRRPGSERWRSEFLYSRAATIYGGSAEIQRNIIARRLLDLGNDR